MLKVDGVGAGKKHKFFIPSQQIVSPTGKRVLNTKSLFPHLRETENSHLISQPTSQWHGWRRRARIPTMMILPKLVYKFNMIPVKISTILFFSYCGRVDRVVLAN